MRIATRYLTKPLPFGMLVPVLVHLAAAQAPLASALQQVVSVNDPVVALVHVRVIDGTGSPARPDQTVVIDHEKISAVGNAGTTSIPEGAHRLDLTGATVYPGLVGMHEHLFYPAPSGGAIYNEEAFSAPLLYLASGVTTMRTAGSLEPYTDLNVKKLIDTGGMPGPEMDVTGPYIQGPRGFSIQMPVTHTAEEARRLVDYWAGEGVTSFKAYMNISHDALKAAIDAAHAHKLKITGHLCSVGFTEAAELGIDDLEHGLLVDTEFTPGKQEDICPAGRGASESIVSLDLRAAPAQRMIQSLVQHHVAVTSTLSVFEAFIPGRPPLTQRMLDAMSPDARLHYLQAKERAAENPRSTSAAALRKEMDFERAFVAAGGLLIAGCDPTGNGGALPGYGDQRNLELLVEAGFKPEEAIRIYSYNAAIYLGRTDQIGSIAPGKQADLVVVTGDPSAHISDVENVRYVFKKGLGYDPAKLLHGITVH